MSFSKIDLNEFSFKPFSLLAKDWALLVAGSLDKHNAMTISWGGFGVLWNKMVAFVYVRPQRFTKTFMDVNKRFSLNFFDEKYRSALQFCGANSGKNVDKDAKTGLEICEFDEAVGYRQSKLVFVCNKLYVSQFDRQKFLNPAMVGNFYAAADFHFVYIAEIEGVYLRQDN